MASELNGGLLNNVLLAADLYKVPTPVLKNNDYSV